MTDHPRPGTAVGARLLALAASLAAALGLMGGMAAAADNNTATGSGAAPGPGSTATVAPQQPAPAPQLRPTTAPPTTTSRAS